MQGHTYAHARRMRGLTSAGRAGGGVDDGGVEVQLAEGRCDAAPDAQHLAVRVLVAVRDLEVLPLRPERLVDARVGQGRRVHVDGPRPVDLAHLDRRQRLLSCQKLTVRLRREYLWEGICAAQPRHDQHVWAATFPTAGPQAGADARLAKQKWLQQPRLDRLQAEWRKNTTLTCFSTRA